MLDPQLGRGASEGLGPGEGGVACSGELIAVERAWGGSHHREARRAGVRQTYHRPVHDPAPSGLEQDRVAHVQIQFTIDDPDRADGIIEQLLADRMIACGQRGGPVVSRYWWQGSLERAEEWLVLLKTRTDLGPAVIQAVAATHPYETPEVVAVALSGGASGYLAWIDEVTGPAATIGPTAGMEER